MKQFKHFMFNLETDTGRKKYEEAMTEQANSGGMITISRIELIRKHHRESDSDGAVSEWDEFHMMVEWVQDVPAKEKDGEQELPG